MLIFIKRLFKRLLSNRLDSASEADSTPFMFNDTAGYVLLKAMSP